MLMERSIAEKIVDFLIDDFKNAYYTQDKKTCITYVEKAFEQGFSAQWSLGGTHGSCWGDKTTSSPEPEAEMTQLDDFLIKFYLQGSAVQLKVINRKIKRDSRGDSDYYGGEWTNATKTLSFNDLHDALIEAQLEVEKDDKVNIKDIIKQKASYSFSETVAESKTKKK